MKKNLYVLAFSFTLISSQINSANVADSISKVTANLQNTAAKSANSVNAAVKTGANAVANNGAATTIRSFFTSKKFLVGAGVVGVGALVGVGVLIYKHLMKKRSLSPVDYPCSHSGCANRVKVDKTDCGTH